MVWANIEFATVRFLCLFGLFLIAQFASVDGFWQSICVITKSFQRVDVSPANWERRHTLTITIYRLIKFSNLKNSEWRTVSLLKIEKSPYRTSLDALRSSTGVRLAGQSVLAPTDISTSLRCRWQTRATQRLAPTVLYTDVDGQYDKLVTDDGHQFTHTNRPLKLTAPETISCSRDMVGAHQNLMSHVT